MARCLWRAKTRSAHNSIPNDTVGKMEDFVFVAKASFVRLRPPEIEAVVDFSSSSILESLLEFLITLFGLDVS